MASDIPHSPPPFSTADPEVFAERISPMSPDVSVRRLREGGFFGEAAAVILPRIRLARIGVRNFDVTAPVGRGYSSVTIPLKSGFRILDRDATLSYGPMTAHFQSYDRPFHLLTENTTVLAVNVEDSLLNDVREDLTATRGEAGPDLGEGMSLTDSHAVPLWRAATRLWCDLRRNSFLTQSTIALREREMALVEQLLISLRPDDVRHAIGSNDASLRRTEDWILAHLDEPISRADLCAVSGMNVRTLTRAFQRRHAQSPMAFVRERRLDEVRRTLLAGGRERNCVSEVALDYGFCHLGRFSADYRRAFGELPSETLRN